MRDRNGDTALAIAAFRGLRPCVVTLLRSVAMPNSRNYRGIGIITTATKQMKQSKKEEMTNATLDSSVVLLFFLTVGLNQSLLSTKNGYPLLSDCWSFLYTRRTSRTSTITSIVEVPCEQVIINKSRFSRKLEIFSVLFIRVLMKSSAPIPHFNPSKASIEREMDEWGDER